MRLRDFNVIIVSAIALASLAGSVHLHRQAEAISRERNAGLREQERQLGQLAAENQRLSNLVARVPARDPAAELQELRAHVAALRQQVAALTNDPDRNCRRQLAASEASSGPTWREFAGGPGRGDDAMVLSRAFNRYAAEHDGEPPATFASLASYLAQEKTPLTGTNEFEIVFQGSFQELKYIPRRWVAVLRERQPATDDNGSWTRVYGMADGTSVLVESEDSFQSWEAGHVIPPPPLSQ